MCVNSKEKHIKTHAWVWQCGGGMSWDSLCLWCPGTGGSSAGWAEPLHWRGEETNWALWPRLGWSRHPEAGSKEGQEISRVIDFAVQAEQTFTSSIIWQTTDGISETNTKRCLWSSAKEGGFEGTAEQRRLKLEKWGDERPWRREKGTRAGWRIKRQWP